MLPPPTAKQILELQATGWFDADWYSSSYPDVVAVGMDPAVHYLQYGKVMSRDPGPEFPVRFFREVFKIKEKFEPATRLTALARKYGPPVPEAGQVLRAANEVGLRGRYQLAVQLAENFLPDDLRYSANILRANAAVCDGDRDLWLSSVNAYLQETGVAPLILSGGSNLFSRLGAETRGKVVEGQLISVLMPAFNAEKTLEMAIRSILAQTWKSLEIIVVDDCSTDSTWQILQKLSAQDSRVMPFRNEINVGPYVSKNIALSQARGEWITGHDADDWAHPERVERQLKFCLENDIPASLSGMLRMSEQGSFVRLNRIGGLVHDGACRSGLISLMIRRQYFKDVLGSWDVVRVGGDSELMRRLERVEKKPVSQLAVVTMLCLDNPEGLTNDPVLGYSETSGVSPYRAQYRESYVAAHSKMVKGKSRISFPAEERLFDAPSEMLNSPQAVKHLINSYEASGVAFDRSITSDVAIVTNFNFPGGNASSTIDEIKYLIGQGNSLTLIHCPTDASLGKEISNRFDEWRDRIVNWTDIKDVFAKVIICRHPRVITSAAFKNIAPRLHGNHCFVVKNNSSLRPNSEPAYNMEEAVAAAKEIDASSLSFCAISAKMRNELEQHRDSSGNHFEIEELQWTPTFDLALYKKHPNAKFNAPFRIGRHGRDGSEKWLESSAKLLQAYPNNSDFEIVILGGADCAEKIIGQLPDNWTVFDFGKMEPGDYLGMLDAFVYFPHSQLEEAFGRTVVEAMIAAIPVVLPKRFEQTFGDIPIYCDAIDLEKTIRRIAKADTKNRIDYLLEVQEIAASRFSSSSIAKRLVGTGLSLDGEDNTGRSTLSASAALFRMEIMQ